MEKVTIYLDKYDKIKEENILLKLRIKDLVGEQTAICDTLDKAKNLLLESSFNSYRAKSYKNTGARAYKDPFFALENKEDLRNIFTVDEMEYFVSQKIKEEEEKENESNGENKVF